MWLILSVQRGFQELDISYIGSAEKKETAETIIKSLKHGELKYREFFVLEATNLTFRNE